MGKGENTHEYSDRFDHGLSRVGKDDVSAAIRGLSAPSGLARRDIGERLRRGERGRDVAAGIGRGTGVGMDIGIKTCMGTLRI